MLGKSDAVHPLEYPVLPGATLPLIDLRSSADLAARVRELEAEREEWGQRTARQVEAARREALEQGKAMAAGDQAGWRKQCAGSLAAAVEEFRKRRDAYLAQVEQEVVRLALAIAERILHREAQMDPLLLSGAVRVALGQLADSTTVRLHVPAPQREMWDEMLRLMPGLPLRPELVAEPDLEACDAWLETTLGRVDLGVRAQIAEIERGFFDLLEVRTAGNSKASDAGKQG
jgi:flagellar assembly protein FliH